MDFLATNPEVFKNYDEPEVLASFEESIRKNDAKNFALIFTDTDALGALDLNERALTQLLDAKDKEPQTTTWINIWTPESQIGLIQILGKRYGFSPRLQGLMCTKPFGIRPERNVSADSEETAFSPYLKYLKRGTYDPEEHVEMYPSTRGHSTADPLNHYRIVEDLWHFHSVDWGQKYACIGFNSLYNVQAASDGHPCAPLKNSSKPNGERIWQWLVHTDDGTVISIHENPIPPVLDLSAQRPLINLGPIRRHTRQVVQRLSKAADPAKTNNPIMTLTLRSETRNNSNESKTEPAISETPSLLFYYLFDDWYTTYGLVAKGEHQYGPQLEALRIAMFKTAELEHVDTLHHYGRQLAVLRRIYQSYDRIIERLLERQRVLANAASMARDGALKLMGDSSSADKNSVSTDKYFTYGIPLATGAAVRFETLRDRIRLYALSEIQECLDEKDALVQVNFNLIGRQEASAIETLTRITILLAKLTILFLPVSLLTAYFSTGVVESQGYTIETFWLSFLVLFMVSFIFLVAFGILSGTQESKPIYQSLTKTTINYLGAVMSARSKRRKDIKAALGR